MSKNKKPRKKYMPKPAYSPFSRFNKGQQVTLGIAHYQMVDAIAKGDADDYMMYSFCHAIYVWSKLRNTASEDDAILLNKATEVCHSMIDRYKKIGTVVLTGTELQIAREMAAWMDEKTQKAVPEKVMSAINKSMKVLQRGVYGA